MKKTIFTAALMLSLGALANTEATEQEAGVPHAEVTVDANYAENIPGMTEVLQGCAHVKKFANKIKKANQKQLDDQAQVDAFGTAINNMMTSLKDLNAHFTAPQGNIHAHAEIPVEASLPNKDL